MLKCIILGVLLSLLMGCARQSDDRPAYLQWQGKRIVILGDSITQDGLYAGYLEYLLRKQNPDLDFDMISIGLSSETVSGLTEPDHPYPRPCVLDRLDRALDLLQPDIVTACYGMNDGIYHPQSPDRMQAFQSGMQSLIAAVQESGAELILFTPPPFDPVPVAQKTVPADAKRFGYATPFAGYAKVLGEYSRWLQSLDETGLRVIDLHSAMKEYVEKQRETSREFTLAPDGVHPQDLGHFLMALTILNDLGAPVQREDLPGLVNETAEDSLFILVEQRRKIRSQAWLEYIGYTREETVQNDHREQAQEQGEIFHSRIRKLQRVRGDTGI